MSKSSNSNIKTSSYNNDYNGCPSLLINELYKQYNNILYISDNEKEAQELIKRLKFFNINALALPSWDCPPYSVTSPHISICAKRIGTLSNILHNNNKKVVILSAASAMQYLPPKRFLSTIINIKVNSKLNINDLKQFLKYRNYIQTDYVFTYGQWSIRGGIIDIYTPGFDMPCRIDIFGDTVESIKLFDPISQITTNDQVHELIINPYTEVELTEENINNFNDEYLRLFSTIEGHDSLYRNCIQGLKYEGYEHFAPLFYMCNMSTIFDYCNNYNIITTNNISDIWQKNYQLAEEYFNDRYISGKNKIIKPNLFYINPEQFNTFSEKHSITTLNNNHIVQTNNLEYYRLTNQLRNIKIGQQENKIELCINKLQAIKNNNYSIIIACKSSQHKKLFMEICNRYDAYDFVDINSYADINIKQIAVTEMQLNNGFSCNNQIFLTLTDILGTNVDITLGIKKKKRKDINLLTNFDNLQINDLIVHVNHGIGRYEGIETIKVNNSDHDFIKLVYSQGDKLLLPVENLELIYKYGNDNEGVLDKLGSSKWQNKKSQTKKYIFDIAQKIVDTAMKRRLIKAPILSLSSEESSKITDQLPFVLTEDQEQAIHETTQDLCAGYPMERIICGDVGFGKTEIAIRAAFIVAKNKYQVALVAPTTLLVKQHYENLKDRLKGLGIRINFLSRVQKRKEAEIIKADLQKGKIDIIIGTHALLNKNIGFKNLALVIIDEEQNFGVYQKEFLKEQYPAAHLLTLTATPIPRTMQLACYGIYSLSTLQTPPIDRLPIKTFVIDFDEEILREAIMREIYRSGQILIVCPRIKDLAGMQERIIKIVSKLKTIIVHGGMQPNEIESSIEEFYNHKYDALITTNIIENGLNIINANTIIINRVDYFGLSQIYQLRGRVGRHKQQGYAYLIPEEKSKLSDNLSKRLNVMKSLDYLGGGMSIASHDLDIRGCGNLLGSEQSGHVKGIGIDLYQNLINNAVQEIKENNNEFTNDWSTQIDLGISTIIPSNYIKDINTRLQFYRRIIKEDNHESIITELQDRFGKIPQEIHNLFAVIKIKFICKKLNIEKLFLNSKGLAIFFYENYFANAEQLLILTQQKDSNFKILPNQSLMYVEKITKDIFDKVNAILNKLFFQPTK